MIELPNDAIRHEVNRMRQDEARREVQRQEMERAAESIRNAGVNRFERASNDLKKGVVSAVKGGRSHFYSSDPTILEEAIRLTGNHLHPFSFEIAGRLDDHEGVLQKLKISDEVAAHVRSRY